MSEILTDALSLTVRLAEPADKPQLIRLLKAQMEEHDIATTENEVAFAIEGFLKRPEHGCLIIAADDREIMGVACVSYIWTIEHGGNSSWLQELYVLPSQRNKGIGQMLLGMAFEESALHGCNAVDLEVEFTHGRVESLYRRNGFVQHTRSRWVKPLKAQG